MKRLKQLTEIADAALRELQEEMVRVYPVGSIVRSKIHGREVWIESEVIAHAVPEDPHCLRVRNVRTGKTRCIIARPGCGHSVELVRLPENSEL
jgi:hypothetical protein